MNQHAPLDSDAEFVERIRSGIARSDRFRWIAVTLYVVAVVGVVALAFAIDKLVRAGFLQGMGPGFFVGLSIGLSFGLLLVNVVHGLLGALTAGGRTERLLVRYFDLSRQAEAACEE
jgi:hypothetical protein